MNASQEAIRGILGINTPILTTTREMAKYLKVTFLPEPTQTNANILKYTERLKTSLLKLGIKIIPFEQTLVEIKDIGKKIKPGVVVFAIGERETGKLPIDYTYSFTQNPIVTILDKPKELCPGLKYETLMKIGLELFTWHMSNVIICVDDASWIVFSFNGFSSFHPIQGSITEDILYDFIPKIATRVSPPQMLKFNITKLEKNLTEITELQPYIKDLVESGQLFAATGLFPPMRKIDEFPFRNDFYRWAAGLHLDERSGMSYGFITRLLPLKLHSLIPYKEAKTIIKSSNKIASDLFRKDNILYLLMDACNQKFVVEVPAVWVLMSRSGSEKTSLDPHKDILKIGLVNGQMQMEVPTGIDINEDYKPSFDTRVILSHCVANAIFASVLKHFKKESLLPKILETNGLALAHWHNHILPELVPRGWYIYGKDNPPVLCSSRQAALFAFKGKERAIDESLHGGAEFIGDIHIEPQHGINISWETLKGLGNYLLSHSLITRKNNVV